MMNPKNNTVATNDPPPIIKRVPTLNTRNIPNGKMENATRIARNRVGKGFSAAERLTKSEAGSK